LQRNNRTKPNSTLDRPEEIVPTPIVIVEGLHPWYDKRVKDLLDYTIYLDISDEIKRAWKIQRDMAERGWTLEQIEAEIEKRKPDFDKFVGPQKEVADAVIQVLPTQLTNDPEGKILRVRLIQKDGAWRGVAWRAGAALPCWLADCLVD
jgi:phosphoribulokinase